MSITIQVEDEVQRALAGLALKEGMELSLRIVLGADEQPTPTPKPERPPAIREPKEHPQVESALDWLERTRPQIHSRTHQRIGPRLLREHSLNCEKGYYSKTGVPYQKPDSFPAVFFDPDGYFIVMDEPSMRSNPYINVGKQISIPKGLNSIPGYIKCAHVHS